MRIYSNVLGWDCLLPALRDTGLESKGIVLRAVMNLERHEKRKRWEHAFDFTLRAKPGKDHNGKVRNSPSPISRYLPREEDYSKAPTYDEWGVFIAHLYTLDPNARIADYKSAENFHKLTENSFNESS